MKLGPCCLLLSHPLHSVGNASPPAKAAPRPVTKQSQSQPLVNWLQYTWVKEVSIDMIYKKKLGPWKFKNLFRSNCLFGNVCFPSKWVKKDPKPRVSSSSTTTRSMRFC